MPEYARRVELQVAIAGHDVASAFAPYLLDFTYRDNISGKADEVQLTLHNRDGRLSGAWALKKGLPVIAAIICHDWENPGCDLTLPCGQFKIDELEFSGPPDKIAIKAVSADLTGPLRDTRRTRAWENTSLSGVAGQLAKENGLELFYQGDAHPFQRQDQRNESDISFLSRIALDRGCRCKVHNGKLAIFDAEQAESASPGLAIPKKGGMYSPKSYSFKIASSQTAYTGAKVAYTDPKTGTTHMAQAKSQKADDPGAKELTLQSRVESASQAITLGRAKLHEENQKEETASLEIMGCPKIAAGQTLKLKDFGVFSGVYSVKSATHKISGSGGYSTSLELTKPAPTAAVSAHDAVCEEAELARAQAAQNSQTATTLNKEADQKAKEGFEELLQRLPEILSAVEETLLCLPEIAAAEADRATDNADRQGWQYLEKMFYRWFGGKANEDAASNPEVFWVDMDWVLSFPRAKEKFEELQVNMINEAAKQELTQSLKKAGKLTGKIEKFDFITVSPRQWQALYHQSRIVESPTNSTEPLYRVLGKFKFIGLAKGWIEPLPEGGHRIHVIEMAIAVHDMFNFENDFDPLGAWSCYQKKFLGIEPHEANILFNYNFNNFRAKFKKGNDYLVVTPPKHIDNGKEIIYATTL